MPTRLIAGGCNSRPKSKRRCRSRRGANLTRQSEPQLPIVSAMGTCCDDPIVTYRPNSYTRQHVGLDIIGYDGISDSAQEIYNLCQELGIKNIVMMGVHTNMCVLGRPFGIRQQVKMGLNVALVRDLTDTMYDPRHLAYVSHERGTELVIEHIEKYWCPSFESGDLTRVVPGSADPASGGISGSRRSAE